MRKLRYCVAASLDGFIAGPNGEYDWIVNDPTSDFGAFYNEFDTVVMGRRTFELVLRQGSGGAMPGMQVIVFSGTLRAGDYPAVSIVASGAEKAVADLKAKSGKDIWLFGGGILFRSLLDAQLVDTIEVALMPVLLSQGIPLLPTGRRSTGLRLTGNKVSPSGVIALTYAVTPQPT